MADSRGEIQKSTILGKSNMIFVTVGTGSYDFSRLLSEMDKIAAFIGDSVLMQSGDSLYKPQNAKSFKYCSSKDMENHIIDSKVVISHCGIGTIISILKQKKPFILVPRLHKYGELVDDHQLELARELEKNGIKVVYDTKELKETITHMSFEKTHITLDPSSSLALSINKYLYKLANH
jgi:beta-1,4-N-acetylglucosaminyltransferase